MKPEIKKRWVDALRSGQYKQCRSVLSDGKGFCCLGVLTNLYALEVGEMWESSPDPEILAFDGECGILHPKVAAWAGLKFDRNPSVKHDDKHRYSLSQFNDSLDYDFNEIADAIENDPQI